MLTGQILLQLVVILVVVQIFGYLSGRIGQQWVIGEILAGLALGPSLLGAFWPGLKIQLFPAAALPTLQTLGDIGLVLYMFSLGARLDTHLMLRQSRTAIVTSISTILLPLLLGALLGFFLYPGLAGQHANLVSFILLVGTAMAVTAFPVLARLLAEKDLLGTRVGMLALTCAAIDDVIAWCLLATVVALIHARGLTSLLDRKSTRLNSSHANISYAVFCLKKKKSKQRAEVDAGGIAAKKRKDVVVYRGRRSDAGSSRTARAHVLTRRLPAQYARDSTASRT